MKNGSSNERFKYSENVERFTPMVRRLKWTREREKKHEIHFSSQHTTIQKDENLQEMHVLHWEILSYFISSHTNCLMNNYTVFLSDFNKKLCSTGIGTPEIDADTRILQFYRNLFVYLYFEELYWLMMRWQFTMKHKKTVSTNK